MVELLVSTAVFTIVLIALFQVLNTTLSQFSDHAVERQQARDFRSLFDSIRIDTQAVVRAKPTDRSYAGLTSQQEEFFQAKRFIPIEINRRHGGGSVNESSFVNGESPANFSTLLFAAIVSASSYNHPMRERLRLSATVEDSAFHQSSVALSEACLIGYYVAYTRDSDHPDSRRSMKLYRHFRGAGINFADGHSNGILARAADLYDPTSDNSIPAFLESHFFNREFPFLLASRYLDVGDYSAVQPTQPWHLLGDLVSEPTLRNSPDYDTAAWSDDMHSIHDFVFPDEIVARNVLEFTVRPYKKIETPPGSGVVELVGTQQFNEYLNLNDGSATEWPVFIKPDLLDITLSIINDETAVTLESEADWTLPESTDTSNASISDRLKLKHLRRYSVRIAIF